MAVESAGYDILYTSFLPVMAVIIGSSVSIIRMIFKSFKVPNRTVYLGRCYQLWRWNMPSSVTLPTPLLEAEGAVTENPCLFRFRIFFVPDFP